MKGQADRCIILTYTYKNTKGLFMGVSKKLIPLFLEQQVWKRNLKLKTTKETKSTMLMTETAI